MEQEQIKTFNSDGEYQGIFRRDEVHSQGLWHETFHCWFIKQDQEKTFIHFQLRSDEKKDFPGKLDISAAGHILASEQVEDGVREIQEELGIHVSIDDLIYVGGIPDVITEKHFIDREIAHVYMYLIPENMTIDYTLQVEEVIGMAEIELTEFEALWYDKKESLTIPIAVLNDDLQLTHTTFEVTKDSFVPHKNEYMESVLTHIKEL